MHGFVRTFFVGAALAVTLGVPANAEVGLGTDVVSRYVWRGADLGNAAAVQPWISYGNDAFEVGAWSSWAINDGGANENDLYVSFGAGPVGITVTDYFFPAGAPADFFDYSDDAGVHIIEVTGALDLGVVSVLGAINLSRPASEETSEQETGRRRSASPRPYVSPQVDRFRREPSSLTG